MKMMKYSFLPTPVFIGVGGRARPSTGCKIPAWDPGLAGAICLLSVTLRTLLFSEKFGISALESRSLLLFARARGRVGVNVSLHEEFCSRSFNRLSHRFTCAGFRAGNAFLRNGHFAACL